MPKTRKARGEPQTFFETNESNYSTTSTMRNPWSKLFPKWFAGVAETPFYLLRGVARGLEHGVSEGGFQF